MYPTPCCSWVGVIRVLPPLNPFIILTPSVAVLPPFTSKVVEGEAILIPNLALATSAFKKFVSLIKVELEA